MSLIKTFPFNKQLQEVSEYHFGKDWPAVYILENGKDAYVGETTNAFYRGKQHFDNPDRRRLAKMHIITDDEYNKSATLDTESLLIQYMAAEGTYILQNKNVGMLNHNYFDREKYQAKFEIIWEKMKKMSLVKKDLLEIKNSDLFKYSPFKALSIDQLETAKKVINILKTKSNATIIISGKPGTGKTILASYLIKRLQEEKGLNDLKTGLVVPMTSLRKTIKQVFKSIKNLKPGMVLGPSDVVNENYDLLIVDESHRLHRRKSITNYKAHDDNNKKLGLGIEGTELDWIVKSSRYQILFYDENQSVRPADVLPEDFKKLGAEKLELVSQMRVEGGEDYLYFIDSLFSNYPTKGKTFRNYDFRVFDNLADMVAEIQKKEKGHQLSRLLAGYAWEWSSKNDKDAYDIVIDNVKLRWNSVTQDWVNSENAVNEVGCIHTVQGYDLNYAGIIIGPELTHDPITKRLKVMKENYKDRNGAAGIEHEEELERYILNIYKTLLTRGIKGTYIYACDERLQHYLTSYEQKTTRSSN